LVVAEDSADLTSEVNDVREFLDSHQVVEVDSFGLADSVDVVPSEIDQHDMFRSVLFGCRQLGT
jgi:hypothetical protein